ncbi:MAG: hypothetical protein ACPGPS_01800 [Rubripirellula sp.]
MLKPTKADAKRRFFRRIADIGDGAASSFVNLPLLVTVMRSVAGPDHSYFTFHDGVFAWVTLVRL